MKSITQDYSELHLFQDEKIGFFSAICLHLHGRGPAIGGCRFIHYSTRDDAIHDAIRLSKAMGYKAAISELAHDGGKAVIMLPQGQYDRNVFLKKFAECVHSLQGKYITTVDSGTTQQDMSIIKQYTPFVTGYLTGTEVDSNPSDSTALGIYTGIKIAVKLKLGKDTLKGLRIAVQGVGSVGYRLAHLLYADGAILTVSDINKERTDHLAQEMNVTVVPHTEIYKVACDIFSPCALGRIINNDTIALLQTKIIAGAANDQLATNELSTILAQKDILYIPDYLINAGGLIHLALEMQGKSKACIETAVKKIGDRILYLTNIAKEKSGNLFQTVQEAAF